MWRHLSRLVGAPTVVVCLFVGTAGFLWAAVNPSPVVTLVGVTAGVFFTLGALAMVYLVWLKRVNRDIDTERHEIRNQLDDVFEENGPD